MKRIVPLFVVVVAVLAACGAPGAASPDPASPEGDAEDEGPGADEAVLVVDSAGGFVPIEFTMTRLPSFVMLGDGRVIMHGMQTLEFPGPALPPLIERTLTDEGIQAVLAAVDETNLFAGDVEFRGAQNFIADASDTLFTLNAGGREVTVSIYGLGAVPPDMDIPPGMPSGEVQAHEVLGRLNERLTNPEAWLPPDAWEAEGWQPHEPDAFRLYVRDATGEPIEGGDLPAQVRQWPTDDDPGTFGEDQGDFMAGTRCGVVDGDLAKTWLAELSAANQNTVWTDDGERRFVVLARPVLPHEEAACPELEGA